MNNAKISVIVPIYKVENYLEKCITSIINQTYKNLEIILVDDGSPDRCGDICDKFAKMDNRIKVIHKENGGLSSARNSGIDISTGDYISFIDSDDWISNDLYETLITILNEENDIDIIEYKSKEVSEREINLKIYDTKSYEIFNNEGALKSHFNSKYFYISACSKIYKKNLFDNIKFPIGKLAEDLHTTYKLFYKARKLAYIDYTGYYYYRRPDSIMGTSSPKLIIDVFEGNQQEHEFICKKLPNLKTDIDRLYFNCLLKTYAYLNQKDIETSTIYSSVDEYKNIIKKELNRDDINISGLSKVAFNIYKVFPTIFCSIINFIFNRRNK